MPKKKPRAVTGVEKLLAELIDIASPGRVVFTRSKPIFDDKQPGYELVIDTRAGSSIIINQDLKDSLEVALYDFKSGDLPDPMRPAWSRVSRHHREVVIRTLQGIEARHMARAAKGQLGAKHSAHAEYEIADAFHAALSELWMTDDYDKNGDLLPGTPTLEGEPVEIHIAKPRKPKNPSVT